MKEARTSHSPKFASRAASRMVAALEAARTADQNRLHRMGR